MWEQWQPIVHGNVCIYGLLTWAQMPVHPLYHCRPQVPVPYTIRSELIYIDFDELDKHKPFKVQNLLAKHGCYSFDQSITFESRYSDAITPNI